MLRYVLSQHDSPNKIAFKQQGDEGGIPTKISQQIEGKLNDNVLRHTATETQFAQSPVIWHVASKFKLVSQLSFNDWRDLPYFYSSGMKYKTPKVFGYGQNMG